MFPNRSGFNAAVKYVIKILYALEELLTIWIQRETPADPLLVHHNLAMVIRSNIGSTQERGVVVKLERLNKSLRVNLANLTLVLTFNAQSYGKG